MPYEVHIPGTLETPPMTLCSREIGPTVPWDLFSGDLIEWADTQHSPPVHRAGIVTGHRRSGGVLFFTAADWLHPGTPLIELAAGERL